jgi:hypothetical protein
VTGMLDLFDAPVLPGLTATSDFVTDTDEQALIAAIDAADLSPFRFHGWTGKRRTASYDRRLVPGKAIVMLPLLWHSPD